MAKQYNLQKNPSGVQKNDLIRQCLRWRNFFQKRILFAGVEEIEKKTVGNLESFRMSVIFMFLDSRIHHRKRYVEQVNF